MAAESPGIELLFIVACDHISTIGVPLLSSGKAVLLGLMLMLLTDPTIANLYNSPNCVMREEGIWIRVPSNVTF